MRLSICIPTHHGRCAHLSGMLESVAAQADADLPAELEICVSDNASEDGTEQMVASFRERHPSLSVVYGRNEQDVGMENLLCAVDLATGEWCWPTGSDDVMASDGLLTAMDAIAQCPDAAAVSFPKADFANDMSRRVESAPGDPHHENTALLTGYERIVTELAFVHGFVGSTVVRRDIWKRAVERCGTDALKHDDWPQVVIFDAMAAEAPRWVWVPKALIQARADNHYVTEESADRATMHARLVDGLRHARAHTAGRGTPLYRELMRAAYDTVGSSATVAKIKDIPGHGVRGDIRLAVSFARAFWWHRAFRRHCAPLLAVPAPLWRLARRLQGLRQGPAMRVLEPDECRARIVSELPARLPVRTMTTLRCSVRNEGEVAISSRGDHPVRLAARWVHDEEAWLADVRVDLKKPLAPGAEAELSLRTFTPWEPGRYELHLSMIQEDVRWFEDADPDMGARRWVEVFDGSAAGRLVAP